LSLPGTNDHPATIAASGCTACHVIYANDRDPSHSGAYAQFGHAGFSASSDPTIPKTTPAIPSTCLYALDSVEPVHDLPHSPRYEHGHDVFRAHVVGQRNRWDKMYPARQRNPTEEQRYQSFERNPEGAAVRGLWRDEKFLENVGSPEFNKRLKTTQFADFHGHGWIFRAVFNHDRKGNWLDKEGEQIAFDDPDRFGKAVTSPTSISRRECNATTAISRRTITATGKSTASRAPPSKSTASIATVRFARRPH